MKFDFSSLGQLLQISLPRERLDSWKDIIEEILPGSIVIQGMNVSRGEDVRDFVNKIQTICDELAVPKHKRPLIGITHEGGWISRIRDIANSPGNMALAATGELNFTYSSYRAMGQELASLGIDWNLAPTVDLNTNPENPIIGVRSFGDDPAIVSDHSIAAVKGLEDAGLLTCAKHFPGHGSSGRDSHIELPTIDRSMEEMLESDIIPYLKLAKRGIDSIMISHIFYPGIEGDAKPIPASLSENVVNKLLRKKVGYDGLIVTDSLSMSAVADNFPMDQVAEKSILAGVDILECAKPDNYLDLFHSLYECVKSGKISTERIERSLSRFNKLRGILSGRKETFRPWSVDVLNNVTTSSANRAITILRKGYLDFEMIRKARSLNSVIFTRDRFLEEVEPDRRFSPLTDIIKSWGKESRIDLVLPRNLENQKISESVELLASGSGEDDIVLVFLNDSSAYNRNTSGIPPQIEFVRGLGARLGDKIVSIGTGTPYELKLLPENMPYISAYSYTETSLSASLGVLLGAFPAEGKMPVKL